MHPEGIYPRKETGESGVVSYAPAPLLFFRALRVVAPPGRRQACQRAQKLLSLGRWHELNSLGPGGPMDCSVGRCTECPGPWSAEAAQHSSPCTRAGVPMVALREVKEVDGHHDNTPPQILDNNPPRSPSPKPWRAGEPCATTNCRLTQRRCRHATAASNDFFCVSFGARARARQRARLYTSDSLCNDGGLGAD